MKVGDLVKKLYYFGEEDNTIGVITQEFPPIPTHSNLCYEVWWPTGEKRVYPPRLLKGVNDEGGRFDKI